MFRFKVGQKVRATAEAAAYVVTASESLGLPGIPEADRDVAERRTLTIVHIDGSDQDSAWPIQAMRKPEEYTGDYWDEGVNLFDPEELELVEE